MERPSTPELWNLELQEPILMHSSPERAKGRVIGAEEIKDAGILTTRSEFDEDGLEITNVDNPPANSEVEARRRARQTDAARLTRANDRYINTEHTLSTAAPEASGHHCIPAAGEPYFPPQLEAPLSGFEPPTAPNMAQQAGDVHS